MFHKSKYKKPNNRGFTLIELLVVLAVTSILSSTILVSLSAAKERGRDSVRISDMRQLKHALELFYHENGHYPGSLETPPIAITGEYIGDDNGPIEKALAPFIIAPKDPLHNGIVFFYSYDPNHPTDSVPGSCSGDSGGNPGVVIAFNKAEWSSFNTERETCSGNDMNQDNADYNIVLYPAAP